MDQMDLLQFGAKIGMIFIPFLFALCFHEFAHGWVAKMRGDRTAEMSGRLSLNPFVHADLIGTWILPIAAILFSSPLFFGWAKPVPVNARNLKRPRQDLFWVALAGPLSNVLLAVVGAVLLAFVYAYLSSADVAAALVQFLKMFVLINMFLAVFNLIPIHPLDGGKVIEPFLPPRWATWLDQNQGALTIFLFVIILFGGGVLAWPVEWMSQGLFYMAYNMAHFLV